jgi:hypothetical protein
MQLVDDRARLPGANRVAVSDWKEEEVDGPDRLGLLIAQRALAEVAEVTDAQPIELEGEDRVGVALGAGACVVLGGDRDDLADGRREPFPPSSAGPPGRRRSLRRRRGRHARG